MLIGLSKSLRRYRLALAPSGVEIDMFMRVPTPGLDITMVFGVVSERKYNVATPHRNFE